MSTLSTTISLTSSDLFPSTFTVKKVLTEVISGSHEGFSAISIPESSTSTLFSSSIASGTSGVLYAYIESVTSNVATIDIQITNGSGSANYFLRLIPGDAAYLPIWANDGDGITITANNGTGEASTVNYFFGERG